MCVAKSSNHCLKNIYISRKKCIKFEFCLNWGSVTGDTSVHSWHTHLCMLVGRLSLDSSSTLPPLPPSPSLSPTLVFCQRICFPSSPLYIPPARQKLLRSTPSPPPAPLPVSSSFPLVEKEQINKPTNCIPCACMCEYLLQSVNN